MYEIKNLNIIHVQTQNFHLPIAHGELSGSGLHLPSLSHVITMSLLTVEYILWHESMICVPGAWLNAESLMLKDK